MTRDNYISFVDIDACLLLRFVHIMMADGTGWRRERRRGVGSMRLFVHD